MELDPNAPAAGDGTEAATPSPPSARDLPDAIPLWRFYWFAVGTLGIYLLVWVYRTAKRAWGGRSSSGTPLWWALGYVAPPACAALLIEFGRRAGAEWRGGGLPQAGAAGLPALVYAGILLIGAYSPLNEFAPTLIFLLPIPFLMVQRRINSIHAVIGIPTKRVPRPTHPMEWIGASLGTVALAVLLWYSHPSLLQVFAPRPGAQSTIASGSGRFSVTLPTGRWRVVGAGTIGDADSELELIGPGVASWLVAYANPRSMVDFEGTIDARRQSVSESGTLTHMTESRRFLDGSDFIPISLAEYEVHQALQGTMKFIILTAQTENQIIEVIGYSLEPDAHSGEVLELVSSFRLAGTDNGP